MAHLDKDLIDYTKLILHYYHSFIISSRFFLVSVAVDPEPIPGTLGAWQENSIWIECWSITAHHTLTTKGKLA